MNSNNNNNWNSGYIKWNYNQKPRNNYHARRGNNNRGYVQHPTNIQPTFEGSRYQQPPRENQQTFQAERYQQPAREIQPTFQEATRNQPVDLDDAWEKYKATVRNSSTQFLEQLANAHHGKSFKDINPLMSYQVDVILTKHLNNFITEVTSQSNTNTHQNEHNLNVNNSLQITNVCSISQNPPPSQLSNELLELQDFVNLLNNEENQPDFIEKDKNVTSKKQKEFVSFEPIQKSSNSRKAPPKDIMQPPRRVKFTGFTKESGWGELQQIKVEKRN